MKQKTFIPSQKILPLQFGGHNPTIFPKLSKAVSNKFISNFLIVNKKMNKKVKLIQSCNNIIKNIKNSYKRKYYPWD